MQKDRLQELLNTKEDLHPDLAECIEDAGFMVFVKHPLVVTTYFEMQNAFLNAQYENKKKAVAEAELTKNWETYIWLHERPFRLDAFLSIRHHLGPKRYFRLLREVWTDSENPSVNKDIWLMLFNNPDIVEFPKDFIKASRSRYLMTPAERKVKVKLRIQHMGVSAVRKPTRIYRGYHDDGTGDIDGTDGLSWTLSYEKAEWFSTRLMVRGDTAMVVHGECDPDDMIGYFQDRGEDEVVIDPDKVTRTAYTTVVCEEALNKHWREKSWG